MPEERKKKGGRAGDNRGGAAADERPPPSGAGARREPFVTRERGWLAPMLAPLLIGFALLVGLVIGLGILSVRELNDVRSSTLEIERQQANRLNVLHQLSLALLKLDNEARARGRLEAGGATGIRPPDVRLRNARSEIRKILLDVERLPLSRTDDGRAFINDVGSFIGITEDASRYSLEGFEAHRNLDRKLDALFQQETGDWEFAAWQRDNAVEEAKGKIDLLTWLAALTGLVVAAGATWEVQRRFRQIRRSLDALRRERQFSTQMLEGMVSAVAAIDEQNVIRSANAVFFELFPEASLDAPVLDHISTPEAAKMLAAATSAPASRATFYRGRWVIPHAATGKRRTFDVYSSPLQLDAERGQILTLVDATEVVEAEGEMRRQEALAAVGQAAAQVAHEIKNPLGSIRLGVAMLRDMTPSREAISTIDLVDRGIDHLNKLTSDVTQFSRRRQLSLAEADLNQLLDSSLDLVADKIKEKNTPIEKHYASKHLIAECDDGQLRQVFVNLFANGIDASTAGSPIIVSTERITLQGAGANGGAPAAKGARITIADKGKGMDDETRARVFEPFFTTKKRGTGLGLAIAKQIIEQHGGRIFVESAPGEGTRFLIELPLSVSGLQS
ncbi:MAG: hypothetical protein H0U81_07735 [Pyrinomonadaceae bacterium]|nr:hypothetical protein [Pyrinomonadaceae bacterium]